MIVRLAILSAYLLCSVAAMAGEAPTLLRTSETDRYQQATDAFRKQTTALAQQCRREDQDALAQCIERFLPKNTSDSLFFFQPSDDYRTQPQSRAEETFRKLRREHGQVLMQLARDSAKAGKVGSAMALLYEALYCDGDLEEGREILGQKKYLGGGFPPRQLIASRMGKNGVSDLDGFRKNISIVISTVNAFSVVSGFLF